MHGTDTTAWRRSINSHDGTGNHTAVTNPPAPTCETDRDTANDWFVRIVRSLVGRKPATALHYITGFSERHCHRYAIGETRPPGYFLRALLRSEQGWQFLAALMDGAEPKWWREVLRAKRLAEAIDAVE